MIDFGWFPHSVPEHFVDLIVADRTISCLLSVYFTQKYWSAYCYYAADFVGSAEHHSIGQSKVFAIDFVTKEAAIEATIGLIAITDLAGGFAAADLSKPNFVIVLDSAVGSIALTFTVDFGGAQLSAFVHLQCSYVSYQ